MLQVIKTSLKFCTIMLAFSTMSGCVAGVACVAAGAATTAKFATDHRSTGHMIDDTVLKTKIWKRYVADESKRFSQVTIDVNEGRVLLTGNVAQDEDAFEAIKLAWGVRGVREVINEIVPRKSLTTWDKSQDLLLKSRIKSKFLLAKDLRSTNYTVLVENKIVYLFGIAENDGERETALDMARRIRGVDKVVSYVILKTDQRRD